MNMKLARRHKKQGGLAIIEFTLVATVLLFLLFAIFEIARFVYSIQMLNEATRKAARLAAVCYVDNAASLAQLDSIVSTIPSGFSNSALNISYLNESGTTVSDVTGSFDTIRFVRAQIDTSSSSYTFYNVFTEFTGNSLIPEFETTLPAESLGVPRYGADSGDYTTCL